MLLPINTRDRATVNQRNTSLLQLSGHPIVLTSAQWTTRSGGSCMSACNAAGFITLPSWSRIWSNSGNTSTRWSTDHRRNSQAVMFTSSSLHFSMWRIFLTQAIKYVWLLHFTVTSLKPANDGHFMPSGAFTKPLQTLRFYPNELICLQLDVTLLVQNLVNIWRCLPKL